MNRRALLASLFALPLAPKAFAAVPKLGQTLRVRLPANFVVTDHPLTLTMSDYAQRYMNPAMDRLVKQIEYDTLFSKCSSITNPLV